MTIKEILTKLIGEIEPIGESNTDEKRFENLLSLTSLVDDLLYDISQVRYNKDRGEYSMSRAGKFADEWLDNHGMRE